MDPGEIGYDRTRATQFYRELKTRVAALPGVESVSLSFGAPFLGIEYGTNVYAEDRIIPPGQQPPFIFHQVVSAEYFSNMRIPMLQGRAFAEFDDDHAPPVAIVNQTMARQLWPGVPDDVLHPWLRKQVVRVLQAQQPSVAELETILRQAEAIGATDDDKIGDILKRL